MMRSGSEVEVVDHIPYLLFVLSKAMMGSYIVCHPDGVGGKARIGLK